MKRTTKQRRNAFTLRRRVAALLAIPALILAWLPRSGVSQTLPTDSTAATNAVAIPADSLTPIPPDSIWHSPMLPTEEMLAMEIADAERPMDLNEVCELLAGKMNDYASQYLGTRYRLGATGPKAFDCSGFTQNIFRHFGLDLNRTSRAQYAQGEKIDRLEDVRPGDLLFFSGRRANKQVGHVAMVTSVDPATGELEFIHASSSKGITYQRFPDNGYFSKRYLGARRILGTEGFDDLTA